MWALGGVGPQTTPGLPGAPWPVPKDTVGAEAYLSCLAAHLGWPLWKTPAGHPRWGAARAGGPVSGGGSTARLQGPAPTREPWALVWSCHRLRPKLWLKLPGHSGCPEVTTQWPKQSRWGLC